MLDLDWRVHDAGAPTLVAAVVESTAPTPRLVRLVSRLDGPVMPPRRRGVPERGWSERGFEGVVPASGRLALGFASRGAPVEPPVELVDLGRESRGDASSRDGIVAGAAADDPEPVDVLRDLGSPVPPRDAVPGAESPADASVQPGPVAASGDDERSIPGPVAAWFGDVAGRIERVERLADARELDAAAAAVEASGGLAGVEDLLEAVAADERALRAVADRAAALADACEARESVPVEAYRGLS